MTLRQQLGIAQRKHKGPLSFIDYVAEARFMSILFPLSFHLGSWESYPHGCLMVANHPFYDTVDDTLQLLR